MMLGEGGSSFFDLESIDEKVCASRDDQAGGRSPKVERADKVSPGGAGILQRYTCTGNTSCVTVTSGPCHCVTIKINGHMIADEIGG